MTWKGWEEYEPPTSRESTQGVDQNQPPIPQKPRTPRGDNGGAVPGAGGGGAGGHRPGKKGPARLTAHKAVYIDIERRHLLEGELGKQAKLRRPGLVERLHSKKEGLRYLVLLNEQDAGRISGLRRQVRFALNVRRPDGLEETIAHWTCDFQYHQVERNLSAGPAALLVIEDCKGFRTEMYQRSKRHFEAQYSIKIKET